MTSPARATRRPARLAADPPRRDRGAAIIKFLVHIDPAVGHVHDKTRTDWSVRNRGSREPGEPLLAAIGSIVVWPGGEGLGIGSDVRGHGRVAEEHGGKR